MTKSERHGLFKCSRSLNGDQENEPLSGIGELPGIVVQRIGVVVAGERARVRPSALPKPLQDVPFFASSLQGEHRFELRYQWPLF